MLRRGVAPKLVGWGTIHGVWGGSGGAAWHPLLVSPVTTPTLVTKGHLCLDSGRRSLLREGSP